MRICIDSNQFIFGITGSDPVSETLMLILPRLGKAPRFSIVDEPVPASLVTMYVASGLRKKGDAFIGAFTEWQQAQYLISDNRHFLLELKSTAFAVVSPEIFLQRHFPGIIAL